jgi:hypothetical protein
MKARPDAAGLAPTWPCDIGRNAGTRILGDDRRPGTGPHDALRAGPRMPWDESGAFDGPKSLDRRLCGCIRVLTPPTLVGSQAQGPAERRALCTLLPHHPPRLPFAATDLAVPSARERRGARDTPSHDGRPDGHPRRESHRRVVLGGFGC